MNPLPLSEVSVCLFLRSDFLKSFQIGSAVFIMGKPIIMQVIETLISFHASTVSSNEF